MTLAVTHPFVSAKTDGTDASVIRPSNWNADHTITLATNMLIGRSTAGAGNAEEIACTAAARSILDDATIADILVTLGISPPTTGDIRLTLKTTAPTGWRLFDDGTIGDASSSATLASADCEDLFTLIFDNILDASAAVLTSAGAATTRAAQTNAATAWAAHCRISLPKTLGRALAIAGAGSGLTSRALGVVAGAETVTLDTTMVPSHYHAAGIYDPTHSHSVTGGVYGGTSTYANYGNFDGLPAPYGYAAVAIAYAATGVRVTSPNGIDTTSSAGGGLPHANVQPSSFLNAMVKL